MRCKETQRRSRATKQQINSNRPPIKSRTGKYNRISWWISIILIYSFTLQMFGLIQEIVGFGSKNSKPIRMRSSKWAEYEISVVVKFSNGMGAGVQWRSPNFSFLPRNQSLMTAMQTQTCCFRPFHRMNAFNMYLLTWSIQAAAELHCQLTITESWNQKRNVGHEKDYSLPGVTELDQIRIH